MLRQSAASSMESTRSSARSLTGLSATERAVPLQPFAGRPTIRTAGGSAVHPGRSHPGDRERLHGPLGLPAPGGESSPAGSRRRRKLRPRVGLLLASESSRARLDLPIVSGQDIRYRCGRCGSAFCVCASISPSRSRQLDLDLSWVFGLGRAVRREGTPGGASRSPRRARVRVSLSHGGRLHVRSRQCRAAARPRSDRGRARRKSRRERGRATRSRRPARRAPPPEP